MHLILKNEQIPSQGKAYPPGTELRVRSLLWEECVNFAQFRDEGKTLELLDMLAKNQVITGLDFWELTSGDWTYIELLIMSMSYTAPVYKFKSNNCEKCEVPLAENTENGIDRALLVKEITGKTMQEVLNIPGMKERVEEIIPDAFVNVPGSSKDNIAPVYQASLVPADFQFETSDDDNNGTPIVTLESGKEVTVDYYRLKHFKGLMKSGLAENDMNQVCASTGVASKNLTYFDGEVLLEAKKILEHGLVYTIQVTCPKCSHRKEENLVWGALDFVPFRRDRKSLRNRISFRQTSKPVDTTPSADAVQSGDSPTRQASGHAQEISSGSKMTPLP